MTHAHPRVIETKNSIGVLGETLRMDIVEW